MVREYYFYRRGYWEIGVDAMNRKDADQYIKANSPGAKFIGKFIPERETTATGAVTEKRQQEIRKNLVKFESVD